MSVSAASAASWLQDGNEVALLDTREAVAHGFGHPLPAANAPLSRLELLAYSLVPRRDVRLLVFDDDAERAALALERLAQMGYRNAHAIDGGSDGWRGAGLTLFQIVLGQER